MNEVSLLEYARLVGLEGDKLLEYLDSLQKQHDDLDLNLHLGKKDEWFYAKDFDRQALTDEIYFFTEEHTKIININMDDNRKIKGITFSKIKNTKIKGLNLTLDTDKGTRLYIKFNNDKELLFDSKKDASGYLTGMLGRQIKGIYELLNN